MKDSNTPWGKNFEILDFNTRGTYSNHSPLVKGVEQFQTSLYMYIKNKGLTRRLSWVLRIKLIL